MAAKGKLAFLFLFLPLVPARNLQRPASTLERGDGGIGRPSADSTKRHASSATLRQPNEWTWSRRTVVHLLHARCRPSQDQTFFIHSPAADSTARWRRGRPGLRRSKRESTRQSTLTMRRDPCVPISWSATCTTSDASSSCSHEWADVSD